MKTNLHQAPGPVTVQTPTQTEQRHTRLVRRFLKLRHRANRLIAKRDRRKARVVTTPAQLQWSNRGLKRAIRKLRKRVVRVRAQLRARRAGLTPGVRAILERIAACESKGNPRAIGGGGSFRGKYQFTFGTWGAVGGKGDPAAASEAEQDRRAALLLKRSGTSPWPVCG
jgi:transglycosylase-like protein